MNEVTILVTLASIHFIALMSPGPDLPNWTLDDLPKQIGRQHCYQLRETTTTLAPAAKAPFATGALNFLRDVMGIDVEELSQMLLVAVVGSRSTPCFLSRVSAASVAWLGRTLKQRWDGLTVVTRAGDVSWGCIRSLGSCNRCICHRDCVHRSESCDADTRRRS